MELYKRRVQIERFISTIDSDGDGVIDTIKLVTTDKFLPIVLKQTIDDLGIYTDYDEKEESQVIDLSTLWDNSNDGSNDGGDDDTVDWDGNPYVDGEVANGPGGTVQIEGCTDPAANNYNPGATIPCNGDDSCCEYPFGGYSGAGGGGGGEDLGACHRLSTGYISTPWSTYASTALAASIDWCKATHSSCGTYGIVNGCTGNGCGGTTCCPGPVNSHVLLGTAGTGCDGNIPCDGSQCCENPFEGIKHISTTTDGNGNYNHVWHFYCVKNN